ncbi:MAG: hypothetical protein NTW07_00450 [candidate division Zixibacteria bacterium]|nr:hypothetical protein [candidate division Zixibacteria bacterium]
MSATIESIALKIDTPTGGLIPGRGFYQLEEDALYVQVGAYNKHQKFFNYLESDVVRFDIDKDGRLIFIEVSMPRRHWELNAKISPPIVADPADIHWLDFRTRIAEPKLLANENQTSLLIDFMSPHSWRWFTLAERVFVLVDHEHRLAAVMVTDIEDDLAGAQIAAFRKQR